MKVPEPLPAKLITPVDALITPGALIVKVPPGVPVIVGDGFGSLTQKFAEA